jgi:CubicO group peptidase (beta-lactamase class C family)
MTLFKHASLCLLLLTLLACDSIQNIPIGKGYTAKYLCSALFNSELDRSTTINQYIAPSVQPLPLFWDISVNEENKSVTVSDVFFANPKFNAYAFYRQATGCTLELGVSSKTISSTTVTPISSPPLNDTISWPYGSAPLDQSSLPSRTVTLINAAVNKAFPNSTDHDLNTTSFLVAHKGALIAEQYALGANSQTPLIGWSMTKSVTSTLMGLLYDRNKIRIDAPLPIKSWENSDKKAISIRHLLHMTSGLNFDESYSGASGVTRMLYQSPAQIDDILDLSLSHVPGQHFYYSTADANLLAYVIQTQLGGGAQDVYDFYQNELFHPINIHSAFIEIDASGQFVGGAYGFMKARDWARLGQLYLQRGLWNTQQVLSQEWIEYTHTPSKHASDYGAQVWLNTQGNEWPNVSHDAYYFRGFHGQRVIIIPSQDIVIVRTGITTDNAVLAENLDEVISEIISILSQ